MNISKAKDQIRNAVRAYLTRDDLGNYIIPIEKQRPILLLGPPGIGKTAIMEQLVSELGIGLISYSMTHHTRQSAIGLPYISHKTFGGVEYEVTEYTMSEIIASVYSLMEDTGLREGILFLDEINCVSETLSPLMLQFLQYKVFGGHRIPDGWVIIAAGNPPEYNDSAREFDMVTLDRLKKIIVEPDYEAWKQYAYEANIHPAVMSFLQSKRNCFYQVETTASGKSIVTPRGWEDLSRMLQIYDQDGMQADEDLIVQYLQNTKTAREFSVFLDLFNKYKTEYPIAEILNGQSAGSFVRRAQEAGFDEVYTLIGLLISELRSDIHDRMEEYRVLDSVRSCIRKYQADSTQTTMSPAENLGSIIARLEKGRTDGMRAHSLIRAESDRMLRTISVLQRLIQTIDHFDEYDDTYDIIRSEYSDMTDSLTASSGRTRDRINHLIRFADQCWSDDKEMLMIITELTADPDCAEFISKFGSEEYFAHNKNLMFSERDIEIEQQIKELEI